MSGFPRSLAAIAACVLLGWLPTATASAESACDTLGGTVDAGQVCHVSTVAPSYHLDIDFPTGYPDQQPVTAFLTSARDKWVDTAQSSPLRGRPPYLLVLSGSAYHTGGTASLVFAMSSDFGAHPVTSFEAFNYDVGAQKPITLETLFQPGVDPGQVLGPIVKRALLDRGADIDDIFDGVDAGAYQNFALTDDAVVFFFAQGLLLPQVYGPQRITVPRSELAAVLA